MWYASWRRLGCWMTIGTNMAGGPFSFSPNLSEGPASARANSGLWWRVRIPASHLNFRAPSRFQPHPRHFRLGITRLVGGTNQAASCRPAIKIIEGLLVADSAPDSIQRSIMCQTGLHRLYWLLRL